MGGVLSSRLRKLFVGDPLPDYRPLDPELSTYDGAVGKLFVQGELKGYLASRLGHLVGGAPWPWFVVVWTDGRKEHSFEDYGPKWYTIRELEAGYFEGNGPSVTRTLRILGQSFESGRDGAPQRFDYVRVSPDEASELWQQLGLTDGDF